MKLRKPWEWYKPAEPLTEEHFKWWLRESFSEEAYLRHNEKCIQDFRLAIEPFWQAMLMAELDKIERRSE